MAEIEKKGDIMAMFATNKKSEVEGVRVNFGEGVFCVIARSNNPEFRKVFRRITRPYDRQIEDKRLPEDVAEDLLCEAVATSVLLSIEGVTMGGEPLADTFENRKMLLKKLPDFRAAVEAEASNMERFRAQKAEDEGKG